MNLELLKLLAFEQCANGVTITYFENSRIHILKGHKIRSTNKKNPYLALFNSRRGNELEK